MIQFGTQISKKQCKVVKSILDELTDEYRDFYITKSNFRLFIKENEHLLFEALQRGDKIVFEEGKGIAFITGWSDKSPRKYLKILAEDNDSANRLLKVLLWNVKEDLYIKIKKTNPIIEILKRNYFIFKGNRGKEMLFVKKYRGDNNGHDTHKG